MTADSPSRVIPVGETPVSAAMWESLQQRTEFPLSVMMAVTGRCNESCPHCEAKTNMADTFQEMSFAQIDSILGQLADVGTLMITFTGGEPTLRPDLNEIVHAAVEKNFYVNLKTNASLLHHDAVDALVSAGLGSVSISLYHDNPEMHDRFVGVPGAWNKVMDTAVRFRDAKVHTSLSLVTMDWNSDAILKMVTDCEQQGISYMVDTHIASRWDGNNSPLKYQAPRTQLIPICSDPRIYAMEHLVRVSKRKLEDPVCNAGNGSCYIDYDGRLRPCGRLAITFGSLLTERFEDLWLNSKARREVLALRWKDLPVCSECELSGYCPKCLGCSQSEEGILEPPRPEECAHAQAVFSVLQSILKRD